MNNKEAYVLLKSSSSIRASSAEFVSNFQLPESEFHTIFRKFRELKSDRDTFLKRNDLATWESMLFFSCSIESPPKRRLYEDRTIFAAEISNDFRKPLSQLTNKGLKIRLASLLNLIETLALKEGVDSKTIASYGLQLVSCSQSDPILNTFRNVVKCKKCGELSYNCKLNCKATTSTLEQDQLFNSLVIQNSS